MLGLGGGTAVIADKSVPGDILFSVDRAVEKLQLTFSGEEKGKVLKLKFAEERIEEAEELASERDDSTDDSKDATTSDDVENESEDDKHIAEGLGIAVDLLSEVDGDHSDLISRFNKILDNLPEQSEVKVKLSDSGASYLKVKTEDDSNKIKIEVKETGEGELLIKRKIEENKVEIETETEGGKFKMKVEDDGRVKIEVENEDKEDSIDDDKDESEMDDDKNDDRNNDDEDDREDDN